MTHDHQPPAAAQAIQAALLMIPVLDAEQKLVNVAQPLTEQLRTAGFPNLADKVEAAQLALRDALLESGSLVNQALSAMTEGMPPAPGAERTARPPVPPPNREVS